MARCCAALEAFDDDHAATAARTAIDRRLVNIAGRTPGNMDVIANNVTTDYNVVGFGDFNGDGIADPLLFDSATGSLLFYELNSNGQVIKPVNVATPSSGYQVVNGAS